MLAIATIVGFLSGMIGTGLGGVATSATRKPGEGLLSLLLGFAGGIMLSVVAFDLLPTAIRTGGPAPAILGFILGGATLATLGQFLPEVPRNPFNQNSHRYLRTGTLVALGIALHDLAEGLAIGSGYMVQEVVGTRVAVIMTLHNIPEGMAVAGPLRLGKVGRFKTVLLTVAAGTPTGFGALAGALVGGVSPFALSFSLAGAGGAMADVVARRLLPDAINLRRGRWCLAGIALGVISGILLVAGLQH